MSIHNAPDPSGNNSAMKQANGRMEIGLRKGVRAFFDVDNVTIAFWGSAWTGREIVTVDDRVVSKKWSMRFVTEHRFEHAGVGYRLVYRVVSLLSGHLEIDLYRNGELIDSDQFRQSNFATDPDTGEFSAWRMVRTLAPYFIGGMLVGALVAYLVENIAGS